MILIKRYLEKRDRGKKRENEGERVRQSERRRERKRQKKAVCIGLHIIMTDVHV